MQPLGIEGAWVYEPQVHADDRGSFAETFRGAEFAADLGYRLDVAQVNCSVSRRGVIRGIHYADVPPGQGKYVTCVAGAILDVIVDLRTDSPSFGKWEAVRLDAGTRRAVFIAEGSAYRRVGAYALPPGDAALVRPGDGLAGQAVKNGAPSAARKAARYTIGLKAEPGWRCAWVTRSNWLCR